MNKDLIKFAIKNRSAWIFNLSIVTILSMIIWVTIKTIYQECSIAVWIITLTIGTLFIVAFIDLIIKMYYLDRWLKPLKDLWNNEHDDCWNELYEKMEECENAEDDELIDIDDLD